VNKVYLEDNYVRSQYLKTADAMQQSRIAEKREPNSTPRPYIVIDKG